MGTIRILIGAAMLAALAANPAAAQTPLNIVATAKQATPAPVKKAKKPATAKTTVAAKPRVKSVAKTRVKARTVARRTVARSAFAQDNRAVIRGPDTIALIAMLPWWRSGPMQTIEYGSEAANSKVMAATDAWLVQRGSSLGEMTDSGTLLAHAEAAGADVAVANPDDVNDIDLAAGPSSPPERSFIQSLIAVLGGALAAAAAGRFLFV